MKSKDQIEKIKAVVLYILKKLPEGVDYIHLFKMMYFAQQEHLAVYGRPVMDDTFVARKHGPVPTLTYKVVHCAEKHQEPATKDLDDFISSLSIIIKDGHQIVVAKQSASPDMDELSASDIRILDKWIARCKDVEVFDLADLSHDKAWLKAQKQAQRTGEDTKIPLVDIALAAGASEAMIQVIRNRQLNSKALQ
jgi:uncharacterized phage-associated protein